MFLYKDCCNHNNHVGVPPQLQPGNNDSTVVSLSMGQNFNIVCNITDSCPFPTQITLTVTGQGNSLSGMTFNLTSNHSMYFTNIMSGDYTCKATNGFGETTFVYTIQVIVPTSSKCCFILTNHTIYNYFQIIVYSSLASATTSLPTTRMPPDREF